MPELSPTDIGQCVVECATCGSISRVRHRPAPELTECPLCGSFTTKTYVLCEAKEFRHLRSYERRIGVLAATCRGSKATCFCGCHVTPIETPTAEDFARMQDERIASLGPRFDAMRELCELVRVGAAALSRDALPPSYDDDFELALMRYSAAFGLENPYSKDRLKSHETPSPR